MKKLLIGVTYIILLYAIIYIVGLLNLHKKYSIAACDVDGYFDWNILNDHGGINGCIYCDTEDEILLALHIMRLFRLSRLPIR